MYIISWHNRICMKLGFSYRIKKGCKSDAYLLKIIMGFLMSLYLEQVHHNHFITGAPKRCDAGLKEKQPTTTQPNP